MIDPSLVLFAIDATLKLGRKVNEVLVDETFERPLLLPLGELFGSVTQAQAMRFFTMDRPDLVAAGGVLHPFRTDPSKLTEVYRAMASLESPVAVERGAVLRREEIIVQLVAVEQFDRAHGAKHPARRILGTLVEIGVEFIVAHPEAMGRDSAGRRVIQAFVGSLQETDFAEGTGRQVLGDLLGAALRTLGEGVVLVDDDARLQVLLQGITGAVADDLRVALASGGALARQQLFRRIGSSVIRGGAEAFAGNVPLFLSGDDATPKRVRATLLQVLNGMRDQEDLFTGESIQVIFTSALRVAAENSALITDSTVLQELIQRVLGVVADRQWNRLFSSATAGVVLHEALEVARENMETLLDPDNPKEQLLATALAAMAGSLSARLAGGGSIQELISRAQLRELTGVVFAEVAKHPEQLIGKTALDPRETVLAQVIASVARALGDNPTRLTNGAGFVELVRTALPVVVRNADKLIDTSRLSPGTNLLFRLLQQTVSAVTKSGGARRLVTREVFLEITERVLRVASANVELLIAGEPKAVEQTVVAAFGLAAGALENRINGSNLPVLIEQLLRQVLWEELDLADAAVVEAAARQILRIA